MNKYEKALEIIGKKVKLYEGEVKALEDKLTYWNKEHGSDGFLIWAESHLLSHAEACANKEHWKSILVQLTAFKATDDTLPMWINRLVNRLTSQLIHDRACHSSNPVANLVKQHREDALREVIQGLDEMSSVL